VKFELFKNIDAAHTCRHIPEPHYSLCLKRVTEMSRYWHRERTKTVLGKILTVIGMGAGMTLTAIAVKKVIGYKEEVEVVDGLRSFNFKRRPPWARSSR